MIATEYQDQLEKWLDLTSTEKDESWRQEETRVPPRDGQKVGLPLMGYGTETNTFYSIWVRRKKSMVYGMLPKNEHNPTKSKKNNLHFARDESV